MSGQSRLGEFASCSQRPKFNDVNAYRIIILKNWLVNTTGFADSFIPVDLLQEHMNLLIKVCFVRSIIKELLAHHIMYHCEDYLQRQWQQWFLGMACEDFAMCGPSSAARNTYEQYAGVKSWAKTQRTGP